MHGPLKALAPAVGDHRMRGAAGKTDMAVPQGDQMAYGQITALRAVYMHGVKRVFLIRIQPYGGNIGAAQLVNDRFLDINGTQQNTACIHLPGNADGFQFMHALI